MLSRGLILSLGTSSLLSVLIFLYFRNRVSTVEHKVSMLFKLIEEHHAQQRVQVTPKRPEQFNRRPQPFNKIDVSDDETDSESESESSDGGKISIHEETENVKTIEISTQDQDTSSEHSDWETDTPPVNVVKTEETKQETNNDGVYQNLMNQISKEEESIDFKKLKMKDLKNLCQKRGLSRYSHLKKNELINLLNSDD